MNNNNNRNSANDNASNEDQMSRRMASIERLMLLINERLGFGLNPPSVQEMIAEGDAGIDRLAFEREILRLISYPDIKGPRDIKSIMTEALVGFVPTRTSRVPSGTVRINALITYLHGEVNTGRPIMAQRKKFVRLQFKLMTREMRLRMKEDGVDFAFWGQLSEQQKLFYALKLEGKISDFGFPIHRCKNQWAAKLLIQEAMKSERQVERRRIQREEALVENVASMVLS